MHTTSQAAREMQIYDRKGQTPIHTGLELILDQHWDMKHFSHFLNDFCITTVIGTVGHKSHEYLMK